MRVASLREPPSQISRWRRRVLRTVKVLHMGAGGATLTKASDERRENASDAAASIGILRQPQSTSGVIANASEDRPNSDFRLALKRADFTRRRSHH